MASRPTATPADPEHGARFVLERQSSTDAGEAVYSALVLGAGGQEHAMHVAIAADGTVEVSAPDDAPAWMVKHVEGLSRQVRTSGQREGVWPRTIRRWKDAPT